MSRQPAAAPTLALSAAAGRAGAVLFRTLFWWRVRHVAQAAYRLLLRRWQAVLVVLLVLSPRDMPILQQLRILAHPVLVLTSAGPLLAVLTTWIVFLAVAQIWSHVQGDVLAGGPPWAFAQAQPLPAGLARRVDLAVLAVGDLPLFLPFVAALVVLPPAEPAPQLLRVAAIVLAAAQLPLTQWLAARRPALAALAAGVQLAGLACLAAGLSALPFLAGTIAAAGYAVRRAEAPGAPRAGPAVDTRGRAWPLPAAAPVWLRLASVDLRGLIDRRRLLRHLSLAAFAGLPWLALEYLSAYGVRPRVVTVVIVLTLVPLVFSVSGLAFELRRLHEPLRPLHASLGVRRRTVRLVDLGVLLAVFLAAAAPLVAAAWASRPTLAVLVILPLGSLALLACATLNLRGDRGVLLFKLVACAAATGAALQFIHP